MPIHSTHKISEPNITSENELLEDLLANYKKILNLAELELEGSDGNVFAKIEDTADGGKLTLYDDTGTKQTEIYLDPDGVLYIQSLDKQVWLGGGGKQQLNLQEWKTRLGKPLECDENPINGASFLGITAKDSAPASPTNNVIYLASPLWDPDSDGNGELVITDNGGTTWQEIVDLPNYT